MAAQEYVRVVIFTDDTILHKPVEQWPYCDALIAFYSKGFPLAKAIKYVTVRQPKMVINDLELQYTLQDRLAFLDGGHIVGREIERRYVGVLVVANKYTNKGIVYSS